jgi:hypothetical protein
VPEKATLDSYVKFLRDAKILEDKDVPKINPTFAQKALEAAR